MGTAFAGIVRAPMTSVVMIFEVTRDYAIIVPLMISNLVSFLISAKLQRQPIYEALARSDGSYNIVFATGMPACLVPAELLEEMFMGDAITYWDTLAPARRIPLAVRQAPGVTEERPC